MLNFPLLYLTRQIIYNLGCMHVCAFHYLYDIVSICAILYYGSEFYVYHESANNSILCYCYSCLLACMSNIPVVTVLSHLEVILWARATWLFSDAHFEISTLPLGFFYTELFHEFVAFIYTIVITLYCFVFINLNIYGSDMLRGIYFALVLVLEKMHV